MHRQEDTRPVGFYFFSKEEFRKDWDSAEKSNIVIYDEAHYVSGHTSQMYKNFYKYIKKHNVENVLLLTATPYLSTPWNIFTLAKILGHDWNYLSFKNQFFEERYIGRRVIPQVREDIEDDISALVAHIGDVVKIEDCIDIPEQTFTKEIFSLTSQQKKAMKEICEVNPIVRFTKNHQIENGTLKSDGYIADKLLDCEKNDRILELVRQNKKVAVIARYNLQLEHMKQHLEGCGKPVYVINGKSKDRDAIIQTVEGLNEAVILINASCSEGYELPSIGLCIFASLSFSYKDYKQMIGRFLRINKIKKNVYLHLISSDGVSSGGVDESVYQAIMSKKDFDIAIYCREN